MYKTKTEPTSSSEYREIENLARDHHNKIARTSKRNPYVRSAFFKKDKVFIKLFWAHLNQKPKYERKRRLKYYSCAIEIIQKSKAEPLIKKPNPDKSKSMVYRFEASTPKGQIIYVQIKEDLRTGNKHFISVFAKK